MGDKFAGGVAERLDEELNSLIQDYETIKEFADFLANSTPEQRQALLNKYGDAAKKLFTDSEYRGQVGEAIVEAFKEGITDDIEKFTRITSGDEKDIGYTTTHAALMAYGIWKRYGKKIGKDVVRAVDDDVAKSTVDSKTLKKAKDVLLVKGEGYHSFRQLKKHLPPNKEGHVYHHIVEQHKYNVDKFGSINIHNTGNVIELPHGKVQYIIK